LPFFLILSIFRGAPHRCYYPKLNLLYAQYLILQSFSAKIEITKLYGANMLYYNLSTYLRTRYGKRMKKICIDGGFSCPNRDGKCGTGGCIYCGERGAGEHIDPSISITEQVRAGLCGAGDGELFIAYFQNFTNTYADVATLKSRYDAALIDERIRILSIGTRPDCIDEDIADLIAEYAREREVWVELGLQTASDETARIINRGYKRDQFERAYRLLSERGIRVIVHLIIGLPGEGLCDNIATAEYIAAFMPFGVKLHSIYVMEGTRLAEMYREGSYTPPTLSDFSASAAEMLARIPRGVVIHRITGDCPRDMLLAPDWNADKNAVIAAINTALTQRGIEQGSFYHKGAY
jgi:radical SAM protein (TIGR01212 family)